MGRKPTLTSVVVLSTYKNDIIFEIIRGLIMKASREAGYLRVGLKIQQEMFGTGKVIDHTQVPIQQISTGLPVRVEPQEISSPPL